MMEEYLKYVHIAPAVVSLIVGLLILFTRKGTSVHKKIGRVWVGAMCFVAVTSLFITGGPFELYNGYGYTHILSIYTFIGLSVGIWAVRNRSIRLHVASMVSVFVGLVAAGMIALFMRD